MAGLDFRPDDGPQVLLGALLELGFTPRTHPDLIKDMGRCFREAAASAEVSLEDQISVRFEFDENGVTGATVTRKED